MLYHSTALHPYCATHKPVGYFTEVFVVEAGLYFWYIIFEEVDQFITCCLVFILVYYPVIIQSNNNCIYLIIAYEIIIHVHVKMYKHTDGNDNGDIYLMNTFFIQSYEIILIS